MSTIEERARQALKATQKVCKTAKNQHDASNPIFGPGGVLSKLFSTKADRVSFIKTEESREIRRLIDALPEPKVVQAKTPLPAGNFISLTDVPAADFAKIKRGKAGKAAKSPAKKTPVSSGRILLRVPRSIHAALLTEAEREKTSLNQLILAKLAVQLQDAI